MVGCWIKKRELLDRDQMRVVALLIGHLNNDVLPYGSISIFTKKFSMAHITMLYLWGCACHKGHISKVIFLCSVVQSCYDTSSKTQWDGKLSIWPVGTWEKVNNDHGIMKRAHGMEEQVYYTFQLYPRKESIEHGLLTYPA